MSFLEELEDSNNQKKTGKPKKADKASREVWENCYTYFKQFVAIMQKNEEDFYLDFNFVFLNLTRKCKIVGPYEINRSNNEDILKLDIKLNTEIQDPFKIKCKNKRSAELLKNRLAKDGVLAKIISDSPEKFSVELNNNIPSIFNIKLTKNSEFYIEYSNICSSSVRTFKLATDNLDQEYMDKLAKYILGQCPDLYSETISENEIAEIRKKLALEKQRKQEVDKGIQIETEKDEELEAIRKANTFKEKSKDYIASQGTKLKNKLLDKIKNLKNK